jgi:hypothetical protein
VQLASPPRRALGLLAAGTIGLSTALLGVTGVAQADPATDAPVADTAAADPEVLAANAPYAPTMIAVEGGDTTLHVFFEPNNPADGDTTTDSADHFEYNVDGGSWTTPTLDYSSGYAAFEITGLANGTTYAIRVRGVDSVSGAGTPSDPKSGTPYIGIGAPGTPAVQVGGASLTISWTAPTTTGTFPLTGYHVTGYASDGESGGPMTLCDTADVLSCQAAVNPGWTYVVLVSAVDSNGNRGDESEAAERTVAIPFSSTVPTKNGDLTVPAGSSSSVAAGKTMTVSGSGYAPGSTVTVLIYSEPQVLTTVVADASGNFTVTVTVPAGLAAGTHTLVASGVDTNGVARYVTLPVTVTAAGTAQLAYTGADVVLPAIGGLVAVAVGGGLIVASRRRSASSAA